MRTARLTLLAAAAALTLVSCCRNGEPDFKKLNARAAKEYLVPIRPGVPGGQPFWNTYANKFTFAPAFDFPEAEGAAKYRFDLWHVSDLWIEYNLPDPEDRPSPQEQIDKYKGSSRFITSFTASSPKADLSPVWNDIPVGYVGLVVTAVDGSGKDMAPVGTWEFLRDFPFDGPYPAAVRSYRDAALMALFFNHRQGLVRSVRNWKEGEIFEHGFLFATKHIGSLIQSEALMAEYIPSCREECLENARKAAALLMSLAQPEGTPLAHLTPTYYDSSLIFRNGNSDGTIAGESFNDAMGMLMTFDSIYSMKGYTTLYDVTGDEKYLNEALAMMRTYDRIIDENGFVPKKLYIRTGEPVYPDGGLSGELLLFIQQLQDKYGIHEFDGLCDRCEKWMVENAMKNFDMSAQYEDVRVDQKPYQNLTNMTAGYYSRYLLQKEDVTPSQVDDCKDMLHFIEDQFIHWAHLRNPDGMFFCLTPGVYEQYSCKITIDASNDCYAEAALSYYEKTGDELFLQKALAIMNTVVNSQACDGEIPTFMGLTYHGEGGHFWLNCSVHSILALLRFAELEEGRTCYSGR